MNINRKKKRISTGKVAVDGVVATRTRLAERKGRTNHPVRERTAAEKREIAYKMSMEYVAQVDIAKALGVSQGRVSLWINEACDLRQEQYNKTAEQWRQFAIARNEEFISKWAKRATKTTRAADVLLGHETRGDKLKGLYVNRSEVSGPGGGPMRMSATQLDYSRYTDEELRVLEHLVEKGTPSAKPVDPPPAEIEEMVE